MIFRGVFAWNCSCSVILGTECLVVCTFLLLILLSNECFLSDGVVLGPQRGSFNHGCGGVDGRRKGDRSTVGRCKLLVAAKSLDHHCVLGLF